MIQIIVSVVLHIENNIFSFHDCKICYEGLAEYA